MNNGMDEGTVKGTVNGAARRRWRLNSATANRRRI